MILKVLATQVGGQYLNESYESSQTNATSQENYPASKVHGANMGPIWCGQDTGGPMNFAIWVNIENYAYILCVYMKSVEAFDIG